MLLNDIPLDIILDNMPNLRWVMHLSLLPTTKSRKEKRLKLSNTSNRAVEQYIIETSFTKS